MIEFSTLSKSFNLILNFCALGIVAICGTNDPKGTEIEDEVKALGQSAKFYHLDVRVEDQVRKIFKNIYDDLGGVYGLANCAGIANKSMPTHEMPFELWKRIFDVNVNGVFLCTKYAIPFMIENHRGSIVNVSSILGIVGEANDPAYSATKGAVRILTKVDALSYAKYNIRVNSIHPGHIDTPMLRYFTEADENGEELLNKLVHSVPMNRLGKAEEIARGILFLLSDESSYMTGSELIIDGGAIAQ